MRYLPFVFQIFTLFFITTACVVDDGKDRTFNQEVTKIKWERFDDAENAFSIRFPTYPVMEKSNVQSDLGALVVVTYVSEPDSNSKFVLSYADYPSEITQANAEQLALKIGENALSELNTKIMFKEELEANGFTGVGLVGESASKFQIFHHVYIVRNRVYQLTVTLKSRTMEEEDARKFLGSFEPKVK